MKKVALITGITGMDGSHLMDLLLEKGYEVHGIVRRSSSFNTGRIDHALSKVNLYYGDVTDSANLINTIRRVSPDEIYNLSAQSHVAVSFEIPEYTANVDAIGTLRLLEAVRILGLEKKVRIYNATTSELYGKVQEIPQKEDTPFYPRSPYGVAKLYSFWICKNYREAYGMHISNGILFNHECFYADTPIIIKDENGYIDIDFIRNLAPERKNTTKDNSVLSQNIESKNKYVWDGDEFVRIKTITRRKIKTLNENDRVGLVINTRNSISITTPNHSYIKNNDEKIEARDLCIDDKIKFGKYPILNTYVAITKEEAKLLGMLMADGYVSGGKMRFSNIDKNIRQIFMDLCKKVFGSYNFRYTIGVSGFGGKSEYIDVNGVPSFIVKNIRQGLYEKKTKLKKIPSRIFNSTNDIKEAFLEGYYLGDGLKKDKCVYKYKSFGTTSPLLAQGVLLLIDSIRKQTFNANVRMQDGKPFYKINLHSDINTKKGQHLKRDPKIIKKIMKIQPSNYVYDIETESGCLNAGIGTSIIGNSPRRGGTFVTKKITDYINRSDGSEPLQLGNLEAQRDWGYAPEYCNAMYLMLQQDNPDDYVVATGETHSVRKFVELAFREININITWEGKGILEKGIDKKTNRVLVEINEKHFRPAEVDLLIGDASKAKNILGWEPTVKFEELVKLMVKGE